MEKLITKKRLLIFTEFFLPAKKGGGPVSSIRNLIKRIHQDFEIAVICLDHDMNSENTLDEITPNSWNDFNGKAQVFYTKRNSKKIIRRAIEEFKPDTIYLNIIYIPNFFILPVKYALSNSVKLVIAPRGMLQKGAIENKTLKKWIYLKYLKFSGLLKHARWHATDNTEVNDIKKWFGPGEVSVIKNIPSAPQNNIRIDKSSTKIKLLYLGLISEKKNLLFLLQVLKNVELDLEFNIFGPVKDHDYWNKCRRTINEIPSNIRVSYNEEVDPELVTDVISKHHLFVLPTKGENFGHAIFESFASGVPVLISDKTPWSGLVQKEIGFDVELDEIKWKEILNSLEKSRLEQMREKALKYAHEIYNSSRPEKQYINLLQ